MYILFGTKWSKLFCGPLMSVVDSTEQGESVVADRFDPLKVCHYISGTYFHSNFISLKL